MILRNAAGNNTGTNMYDMFESKVKSILLHALIKYDRNAVINSIVGYFTSDRVNTIKWGIYLRNLPGFMEGMKYLQLNLYNEKFTETMEAILPLSWRLQKNDCKAVIKRIRREMGIADIQNHSDFLTLSDVNLFKKWVNECFDQVLFIESFQPAEQPSQFYPEIEMSYRTPPGMASAINQTQLFGPSALESEMNMDLEGAFELTSTYPMTQTFNEIFYPVNPEEVAPPVTPYFPPDDYSAPTAISYQLPELDNLKNLLATLSYSAPTSHTAPMDSHLSDQHKRCKNYQLQSFDPSPKTPATDDEVEYSKRSSKSPTPD